MDYQIRGLIPAVYTPFQADGRLNLEQVGPIVEQLFQERVAGLFVCGSTGEGASLSNEERYLTLEAYIEASAGRIPVIAHVGHNSLAEAQALAVHAQRAGAAAIAATPPSYFKPASVEVLIDCLAEITARTPELPFYYYHIPGMTGVHLSMVELLRQGSERLPTLVGLKYSASTVYELQLCAGLENGRFNLLFGSDEMLLSALCVGVQGAVGTTYNFAAPLFQRIISAFERNDMVEAQRCQGLAALMVATVLKHGVHPAFKAIMGLIGLDCGPTRLPLVGLTPTQKEALRQDLENIGFFEWGRGDK
jgi:N-acetylneuraminate lyase